MLIGGGGPNGFGMTRHSPGGYPRVGHQIATIPFLQAIQLILGHQRPALYGDPFKVQLIRLYSAKGHSQVMITENQSRCLVFLGQIERPPPSLETLADRAGGQDKARELSLRGIEHEQEIPLLVAGGHACSWARALRIVDNNGSLCDAGQPQRLHHQGKTTARGGYQRPCTHVTSANSHVDGGDLVLGVLGDRSVLICVSSEPV